MKTVIINRDEQDENQTLGVCYVKDHDGKVIGKFESLERGWRNNKKNVSCIPSGEYIIKLDYSPRFKKKLWEIYGVPNRSECKFHSANYWHQLNGCIALGINRRRVNSDKYLDITNSRVAMKEFHECLKGEKEAILIVNDI